MNPRDQADQISRLERDIIATRQEIARIDDEEIARVARLVIDEGDDEAVVLRRIRAARNEQGLARTVAVAEGAGLESAPLEIVLADRGKHGVKRLVPLGSGGR